MYSRIEINGIQSDESNNNQISECDQVRRRWARVMRYQAVINDAHQLFVQ